MAPSFVTAGRADHDGQDVWDPAADVLVLSDLIRFVDQARAVGVPNSALLLPGRGAQGYGFCGFSVAIPRSAEGRLQHLVHTGTLPLPGSGAGSSGAVAAVWRP
jgi:hypothetical protein